MKKVVNRCSRVSAGAIGCSMPNMMFEDEPVAVGCWFIMYSTSQIMSAKNVSAIFSSN